MSSRFEIYPYRRMDIAPTRINHLSTQAPTLQAEFHSHSDEDRAQHLRSIGEIAVLVQRPVHEVQPLYEDVLATLEQNAVIPDYIPIFVTRRVRQLLSKH